MRRNVLHHWYGTTKGRTMQQQEAVFLQRSITVSCKQVLVQIGALAWENSYVDCTLYEQFYVIDDVYHACHQSKLIRASTHALPFQSESVDMVILPHLLEFDNQKHQVLREVARILKPEGKLTILSFNPWNLYINLLYIKRRARKTPWFPSLESRTRIADWLSLLNFEVELVAGFNFDATRIESGHAEQRKHDIGIVAYAIKATKRSYHLIPLVPVREFRSKFAMAKMIQNPLRRNQYDKNC